MLINYKKKNMMTLPRTLDGKSAEVLRPGMNEFPSEVWEMHKKHHIVMAMVENGDIEEVTVKGKKEGKKAAPKLGADDKEIDISKVEDKDAKSLVKETLNLEILERWEAQETRIEVKKLIRKQKDKINKKGASKKSEDQ